MAEVQKATQSGEMTQRFIEFVMMHAQNAALFLGQIPNPKTGQGEVNLELAKLFIDQLAMIQEKTRGNLTNEEETVLRNALSNLQMAYVEVAQQVGKGGGQSEGPGADEPAPEEKPVPASTSTEAAPPPTIPDESESKKKFTKSYGSD
jgi:uncharacterized protein DUF1844